ncbi:MAG: thioredoxin [Candidatus Cloacimonetes bacterium]|nr:thioredoxin [Candidatus Cloacimonadota bacterium]
MGIIKVTGSSFEQDVLKADTPVLADLWAPWCGPCIALGPTIEELAKDYEGKVKVVKINIDEHPELATRYSVMSIPTLLVFNKGEVVEQLIGLVPKARIEAKIKPYI